MAQKQIVIQIQQKPIDLADLSKRLEKISRDVEAQTLALSKKKPEKRTYEQQAKLQLFLVKEAAAVS